MYSLLIFDIQQLVQYESKKVHYESNNVHYESNNEETNELFMIHC